MLSFREGLAGESKKGKLMRRTSGIEGKVVEETVP